MIKKPEWIKNILGSGNNKPEKDHKFISGATNHPENNPVGSWPWIASLGYYWHPAFELNPMASKCPKSPLWSVLDKSSLINCSQSFNKLHYYYDSRAVNRPLSSQSYSRVLDTQVDYWTRA